MAPTIVEAMTTREITNNGKFSVDTVNKCTEFTAAACAAGCLDDSPCVTCIHTWLFRNEDQLFTKVTESSKNCPQYNVL